MPPPIATSITRPPQPRKTRGYSLKGAVVGSQVHGVYSLVCKPFMSSSLSSKSYSLVFSSILDFVTLFGKITKPFCRPHRNNTCAGVLLCFFATGVSSGSSIRVLRTSGCSGRVSTDFSRHAGALKYVQSMLPRRYRASHTMIRCQAELATDAALMITIS